MIPSTSILSWSFNTDAPGTDPGDPTPIPPTPEPQVITYDLILVKVSTGEECYETEIDPNGTEEFFAYYRKFINGVEDETKRVNVTNISRWVPEDNNVATVTDGYVTGKNEDPDNVARTKIIVSYPNGYAEPKVLDVTVRKPAKPTIDLVVPEFIDATATSFSYTVICDAEAIVECGGRREYTKTGIFTVPENTAQRPVQYTVTATRSDYSSVKVTRVVTQRAAEPIVPTISLIAAPTTIPAAGGNVRYTVTVTPTSTKIRVKCGTDERNTTTGIYSFPENQTLEPITHTITAWCVDNPNISDTVTVTQEGKQVEDYFYFLDDDNYFYFLDDDTRTFSTRNIKQEVLLNEETDITKEEITSTYLKEKEVEPKKLKNTTKTIKPTKILKVREEKNS